MVNKDKKSKAWQVFASIATAGALLYGGWRYAINKSQLVNNHTRGLESKVIEETDTTSEPNNLSYVVDNNVKENAAEETPNDKEKDIDYKTDDFSKEEIEIINYNAKRVGVDAALLMAIRKAESGGEGLEFGIIPTKAYENDGGIIENGKLRAYENEFEKQCSWAAWTIKKNLQRYNQTDKKEDFISHLQKRYCPVGVENDPTGLNKNWEKNVRFFYEKYKAD